MKSIPKIIHQVWVGPRPRPIALLGTWEKFYPHQHYLWSDVDIPSLDKKCNGMLSRSTSLPATADLMRYIILRDWGGVYVDADTRCLRPIPDDFFEYGCFTCYEHELARPGLIANGVIGAQKNHLLLKEAVRRVIKLGKLENPAWKLTGPLFWTELLSEEQYAGYAKIFPSYYFLPRHYTGLTYKGDFQPICEHYWQSTQEFIK